MLEEYKKKLRKLDNELYVILDNDAANKNQLLTKHGNKEKTMIENCNIHMTEVAIPTPEIAKLMKARMDERRKRRRSLISMSKCLGNYRELYETANEEFSFDASISLREMESTYEKLWGKYRTFMKEIFFT